MSQGPGAGAPEKFRDIPSQLGNKPETFRVKVAETTHPPSGRAYAGNSYTKNGDIMKKLMTMGAVALLGLGAYAAEVRNPGESEFSRAQAALKLKAPEEYAKIEKLAAADLDAALREFRKLAREQKIQLPRPRFDAGDRGRRFPSGGGPRGPEMRGGRGMNLLAVFAAENQIREKFPEEFAKASAELAAAEKRIRELAVKAHVQYPENLVGQLRALREKAPERFAAVAAKSADSPREAMMELMRLAEDEKIELALPMRGGRAGRHGERPEARDRQAGPRKLSGPPLRKLRETFPEEMKRYEELRKNDPRSAAKLLRELTDKLDAEHRNPRKE